MSSLEEWMAVVSEALGIEEDVDQPHAKQAVLDLARDVAHGVARPAAPVTAFLVGLAAAQSGDPRNALDGIAARVRALIPETLSNGDTSS